MAGINSKFRAYPRLKDCFPPEHTAVIQANLSSCRHILVTLSATIILFSLVFTTLASASAIPGEPIKLGINIWATDFLPRTGKRFF